MKKFLLWLLSRSGQLHADLFCYGDGLFYRLQEGTGLSCGFSSFPVFSRCD